MLFIVVISSCNLELFGLKNAFYNCKNGSKPDDYSCVYDGNIPNSAPTDESQQKNYFYCATGTGYGCNGDFKCKKPDFLAKCPGIQKPYSQVNLDNLDESTYMTYYNNYLNDDNVKKYCGKVFEYCTHEKNSKHYKDISEDNLKELNQLGFTNIDTTNKSNLNCQKILSDSSAKYCTQCSYEYIKKNPDKYDIYYSDESFGGYRLPGIDNNKFKKSYYISDDIDIKI